MWCLQSITFLFYFMLWDLYFIVLTFFGACKQRFHTTHGAKGALPSIGWHMCCILNWWRTIIDLRGVGSGACCHLMVACGSAIVRESVWVCSFWCLKVFCLLVEYLWAHFLSSFNVGGEWNSFTIYDACVILY